MRDAGIGKGMGVRRTKFVVEDVVNVKVNTISGVDGNENDEIIQSREFSAAVVT